MRPKVNIYIISDNHFNHWNINKYCNRKFKTLEEMNKTMIKRWNDSIKKEDIVIHIGDLIFTQGNSADISNILNQLNGRIVLIHGNHDRKSYAWYLTHGISFICDRMEWYWNNKKILFIHNPHKANSLDIKNHDFIIHGHTHNKGQTMHKRKNCTLINVSVEHLNYVPINLTSLLLRAKCK